MKNKTKKLTNFLVTLKKKATKKNLEEKDKEIENLKLEVEELNKTLENSRPKSSRNIVENSSTKDGD